MGGWGMRVVALALLACSVPSGGQTTRNDLWDTIARRNDLSIFAQYLRDTALNNPLSGIGPVTVFAPSNTAFGSLPPGVTSYMERERHILTLVLKYHMVSDVRIDSVRATSAGQKGFNKFVTDHGATVSTTAVGSDMLIHTDGIASADKSVWTPPLKATVTTKDIQSSNGILHIIDQPLIFSGAGLPAKNIVDLLPPAFRDLVTSSGMEATLRGDGPITIFAPQNQAVQSAPRDLWLERAVTEKVVRYHTSLGYLAKGDLRHAMTLSTMDTGSHLIVQVSNNNTVSVTGSSQAAELVQTDVAGVNGVVHEINFLLIPPGVSSGTAPQDAEGSQLTLIDVILVSALAVIVCVGGCYVLYKGSTSMYWQRRRAELNEQEEELKREIMKDEEQKIAKGRDYNGFRRLGDEGDTPPTVPVKPLPTTETEPLKLNQKTLSESQKLNGPLVAERRPSTDTLSKNGSVVDSESRSAPRLERGDTNATFSSAGAEKDGDGPPSPPAVQPHGGGTRLAPAEAGDMTSRYTRPRYSGVVPPSSTRYPEQLVVGRSHWIPPPPPASHSRLRYQHNDSFTSVGSGVGYYGRGRISSVYSSNSGGYSTRSEDTYGHTSPQPALAGYAQVLTPADLQLVSAESSRYRRGLAM